MAEIATAFNTAFADSSGGSPRPVPKSEARAAGLAVETKVLAVEAKADSAGARAAATDTRTAGVTPTSLALSGNTISNQSPKIVNDAQRHVFGDGADIGLLVDAKTHEVVADAYDFRANRNAFFKALAQFASSLLRSEGSAAFTIGPKNTLVLGNDACNVTVDTRQGRIYLNGDVFGKGEDEPFVLPGQFVDAPPPINFDTGDSLNHRTAQMIPTITMVGGRAFCAWFGGKAVGGGAEFPGDFLIIAYCDNPAAEPADQVWIEYAYFRYPDLTKRVFNPQLFTTPEGNLALIFSVSGNDLRHDGAAQTWITVCQKPLAARPGWTLPKRMTWLGVASQVFYFAGQPHVVLDGWTTLDNDRTENLFGKFGGSRIFRIDCSALKLVPVGLLPRKTQITETFRESKVRPLPDGRVWASWRTGDGAEYSIGQSLNGPWTTPADLALKLGSISPSLHNVFISPKGRLGIVYNAPNGSASYRPNMSVALSDDSGLSFPHKLTFDTSTSVSYPCSVLMGDAFGCVWDFSRGVSGEIRFIKILEDLIVNGYYAANGPPAYKVISSVVGQKPPAALDRYDFTAQEYSRPIASIVNGGGLAKNLAGAWQVFGANTLRRTDAGVIVEINKTNVIRNNSMVGATVGTPGAIPTNWTLPATSNGISRSVVTVGKDANGVDRIVLRFAGTATALATFAISPEVYTQIPVVQGQTKTFTAFMRRVSGSLADLSVFRLVNSGRTSGGASNADQTEVNIRGLTGRSLSDQRIEATCTYAKATTAWALPFMELSIASGATVDFQIEIGWPQVEDGTASSPIVTSGSAVTRPADAVMLSMPGTQTSLGRIYDGVTVTDTSPASPYQISPDQRPLKRIQVY